MNISFWTLTFHLTPTHSIPPHLTLFHSISLHYVLAMRVKWHEMEWNRVIRNENEWTLALVWLTNGVNQSESEWDGVKIDGPSIFTLIHSVTCCGVAINFVMFHSFSLLITPHHSPSCPLTPFHPTSLQIIPFHSPSLSISWTHKELLNFVQRIPSYTHSVIFLLPFSFTITPILSRTIR